MVILGNSKKYDLSGGQVCEGSSVPGEWRAWNSEARVYLN